MVRKWFVPALALVVLFSAAPIWAAKSTALLVENVKTQKLQQDDGDGEYEHKHHKHHKQHNGQLIPKNFEAYRLEKLKEMAVYFGINTDGKSAEQLKKELEAAKTADKQKWQAFQAEHRAKRLEHLRKVASEHGIKTEGKSADQLREELYKLHGGKSNRPQRLEDSNRAGEESGKEQQKDKGNQV